MKRAPFDAMFLEMRLNQVAFNKLQLTTGHGPPGHGSRIANRINTHGSLATEGQDRSPFIVEGGRSCRPLRLEKGRRFTTGHKVYGYCQRIPSLRLLISSSPFFRRTTISAPPVSYMISLSLSAFPFSLPHQNTLPSSSGLPSRPEIRSSLRVAQLL